MASRKRRTATRTSRTTRAAPGSSTLQDPYQSLVAEYLAEEVTTPTNASPAAEPRSKRRRIGEKVTDGEGPTSSATESTEKSKLTRQQVAYEDFHDDATEDESDLEFEDVDFDSPKASREKPLEDLNLVLQGDEGGATAGSKRLSASRRQALTSAHRKLRLVIHKLHILSLISHLRIRNAWCNDLKVQTKLRGILSPAIKKMLKDDPNQTQWQRSRAVKMGLEKAVDAFKNQFDISARGLSRAYWLNTDLDDDAPPLPTNIELPITHADFIDHAGQRSGSRDVGAQLFCSMLRACNLDVRLVCSLQALPFQALMRPDTPSKPEPRVVAFHDTRADIAPRSLSDGTQGRSDSNYNAVPSGVRRFGHAPVTTGIAANHKPPTSTISPGKRKFKESSFPVYWVEVFNVADQKWIAVDPLVLKMTDKPSKFEPPANDYQNVMSYVIGVDEDGFIKDVTRRYAHAFNAKTRRGRIDSTQDGAKFWKRLMRSYRDPLPQDRDQVEDSELAAKEAREPMPRNIVEFKNHPHFALERHLRANEVLNPKRQVGTVSAGVNKPLEPIYRRQDVHLVRSVDAWFRQGRQVKLGEMPLKFSETKTSRSKMNEEDNDDQLESPGYDTAIPLFAAYQTQEYIPPPVLNGIIPKNLYGNIDVYVASMVPAGGVWVNHPFAGGAARLLAIDWADAVTGFEFRGRTGTAVIKGVVVAGEYHDALVTTIHGFQYAFDQERSQQRTAQILVAWKRFLLALRIRERIKSYHVEGEDLETAKATASRDAIESSDSEFVGSGSDLENSNESENDGRAGGGGGFFHDTAPQTPSEIGSDAEMQSIPLSLQPLDPEPDDEDELGSDRISKAVQDARAPIISTWGPQAIAPLAEMFEPGTNLTEAEEDPSIDYTADDDMGGGFIVEETETYRLDTQHQNQDLDKQQEHDDDTSTAGGFILEPNSELEQKSQSQPGISNPPPPPPPQEQELKQEQEQEREPTIPNSTAEAPKANQPSTNRDSNSTRETTKPLLSRELSNRSSHRSASVASVASVASNASSAKGSLLSHDPDDEDAEPEWV